LFLITFSLLASLGERERERERVLGSRAGIRT
jgi:hypothetical protein